MSVSHHHVERVERTGGTGTGMVLGLIAVLLIALLAFFFLFGGPGRFTSSTPTGGQTNVNVPAQSQPSGPQINVPRQIDVNVNQQAPQAPAQAPSGNP